MVEMDLIKLGFEKEFSLDTIDGKPEYYYYAKDITDGLTFITNTDEEVKDGQWFVEFFNTEVPVRYYNYQDVRDLFDLIEKGLRYGK